MKFLKNTNFLNFKVKNSSVLELKIFYGKSKEIQPKINVQQLEKKLNIKKLEDWYDISPKQVGSLYNNYDSMLNFVKDIYPKQTWLPWKFNRASPGYWDSIENQRIYFNDLAHSLNINSQEGFYHLSPNQILSTIYKKYSSLFITLQCIYPNYIWLPWKFTHTPINCWVKKFNRRMFIESISKKLNVYFTSDYYKIKSKQVLNEGNKGFLIGNYASNILFCVSDLYPEIEWKPWKFSNVPKNYWNSVENQQLFFKYLEKKLKIKKLEDWYNIKPGSIGTIYGRYNSIVTLLQNIYPEFLWNPWKFEIAPKSCWKSIYNRRQHLDFISPRLNVSKSLDWYPITRYKISEKSHPSFLQQNYGGNVTFCLVHLYPEILWIPWKFSHVPQDFWIKDENVLQFLNWCENHFKMKSKQEWYFIANDPFEKLGGVSLIQKWTSLPNLLMYYYPEENWEINKFTALKTGGKSQFILGKMLKQILKDEIIFENYKHNDLVFKDTKKKIELDIFIPSLNTGFEYQGKQHYESISLYSPGINSQKQRDLEKKELCKNNSITLIEIPYTWDQKKSSLKNIIKQIRPDILRD